MVIPGKENREHLIIFSAYPQANLMDYLNDILIENFIIVISILAIKMN